MVTRLQYRGVCKLGVVIASALILAACGTRHVSEGITPRGDVRVVKFPPANQATLKGGTFPNIVDLRNVGPGVTKDQLYQMLGRPHFSEGLYGVREWDYLFNFRTIEGVVICQYKVVFDSDQLARSFYWAPESCARLLHKAPSAVEASAKRPDPVRFQLSADALFAFGRYHRRDILHEGQSALRGVASRLAHAESLSVRVIGHTDRIGNQEANQILSERRAATVRMFLVEQGVLPANIVSEGKGESEPVTDGCEDKQARAELIACLAPDRRVEIVVTGLERD